MKVKVFSFSDKGCVKNDYRGVLRITIDGKRVFGVSDGEPEDANLGRDFADCWRVPSLLAFAFRAGKDGEEFEVEDIEVDDWEDMP